MKNFILAGTYTKNSTSEGISVYEIETKTGQLTFIQECSCTNPSFIVKGKQNFIYAVCELEGQGHIESFQFDPITGSLHPLDKIDIKGGSSCHLCLWEHSPHITGSNYGAGMYVTCRMKEDGTFHDVTDLIENTGNGPVAGRQDTAHAHSLTADLDYNYFVGADLGSDRLYLYQADHETGKLNTNPNQPYVSLEPGAGPRHFVFHPNQRVAYAVTELSNDVIAFEYDKYKGTLNQIQKISMLSQECSVESYGADIHISKDGKYLYISVRGIDKIYVYLINDLTGKLTYQGAYNCFGQWPRNFCITPDDQYIIIANQNSGNIVVCNRDQKTGEIKDKVCEVKREQAVCVLPV